jgi:hypothetical protein
MKFMFVDFSGLMIRSETWVCIKTHPDPMAVAKHHYLIGQPSRSFYRFSREKYILLQAAIVYLLLPIHG